MKSVVCVVLTLLLLLSTLPTAATDPVADWWRTVEPLITRFETLKELADVTPQEGLPVVLIAMNDTLLDFHYIPPPDEALPIYMAAHEYMYHAQARYCALMNDDMAAHDAHRAAARVALRALMAEINRHHLRLTLFEARQGYHTPPDYHHDSSFESPDQMVTIASKSDF